MNAGSRSIAARALLFTAVALAVVTWGSAARADRVVVLPVTGEGVDEDRLDALQETLDAAVNATGNLAVSESGGVQVTREEIPQTANEMRAIAELQVAQWVVVPVLRSSGGERYTLFVRVFSMSDDRLEEYEAEIVTAQERRELEAVLRAMIRPEGLNGFDLAAERAELAEGADAEERARREAEERARLEHEERERQRREEEARTEAERREQAWNDRERYDGAGRPVLVQLGLGLYGVARRPDNARGSSLLGMVELRGGYAIEGVPGLEIRGGVDIAFQATQGFSIFGGAAYLASPFAEVPIHIGGALEIGYFQSLSGSKNAAFLMRAGGIISWHAAEPLYLEAQVPEILVLSSGGGIVAVGASVRLGIRF